MLGILAFIAHSLVLVSNLLFGGYAPVFHRNVWYLSSAKKSKLVKWYIVMKVRIGTWAGSN
jgi:hypothetical protein